MNETGVFLVVAEVFLISGGLLGIWTAIKLHIRGKNKSKKTKPEGFAEFSLSEDEELVNICSKIPKRKI